MNFYVVSLSGPEVGKNYDSRIESIRAAQEAVNNLYWDFREWVAGEGLAVKEIDRIEGLRMILVECDKGTAERLRDAPMVKFVEPEQFLSV